MKLIAYLSAILISSSAFAQEEIIVIDRSKTRVKTEREITKNENEMKMKLKMNNNQQ